MESERRVYRPLENYGMEEAKDILEHGTREQLVTLPLSVGEYCADWKFAQQLCISLLNHDDAVIRANAALGLAYIARTKGKLDKRLVKPYLIRELRENEDMRWRIIDAIEYINHYLKWHLAEKALEKFKMRATGENKENA